MNHLNAVKLALASAQNHITDMAETLAVECDRLHVSILDEAGLSARRMLAFVSNVERGDVDSPPRHSADLEKDVAAYRTTRDHLLMIVHLAGGPTAVRVYKNGVV